MVMSTVWRCSYCTYDNQLPDHVCAACARTRITRDIQKKEKRIRYGKSECGSSRVESVTSPNRKSASPSTAFWHCSKCLLENTSSNKACAYCSTEKRDLAFLPHNLQNSGEKQSIKEEYMGMKSCHVKPLPPLISSSMWVCEKCAQQNSLILAHCMVCGELQPASNQTAEQCVSRSYSKRNKQRASNQGITLKPMVKEKSVISTLQDQKIREANSMTPFREMKPSCYSNAIPSRDTTPSCNSDTSSPYLSTQTHREIVEYFRKLKTNFVDDSFRPCNKSINGEDEVTSVVSSNGHHSNTSVSSSTSEVLWLRPHEIEAGYPSVDWTLFRTPLPTDIIQGSLGDCWLLSSLSVLADKPSIIEEIFITKSVSAEGVYELRLCKDGEWRDVIVDDYLPCYPNKKLIFAQSDRKQLWVPLIEKAVAKLFGAYSTLKAGHCGEGLQLLTGAPIESIKITDYQDDLELLWGMLLSYKEAGFPMGVCCMGEEAASLGLTTRHAYSLLNLHAAEHVRLIQLRNPWAKDTWTGRYNNRCPQWTPELRQLLLVFEDTVEAVFWMELTDFVRYFGIMDVCRLHHGWREWRGGGEFSTTSPHVLYLSVCETLCLDVSLIQSTRRGAAALSRAPVDLSVAVVRCHDNTPQTVVEFSGRSLLSSVTCSTLVTPGTYMIVPMSFLSGEGEGAARYTLACFAERDWVVWEGTGDRALIPDVLFKVAETKGEERDALQGCSVYQLNKKIAGLVIAVENRNPHRFFHITSESHNTSNVVSTRGDISTTDWIPPLSRMIVMILTQLDETCGFKIQSSYKFSVVDLEQAPDERTFHSPPICSSFLHRVSPL